MKVNFSANLGLYRGSQPGGLRETKSSLKSGKTDVADFSRGSGAVLDKSLLTVKSAIQNEVYAPAGNARLSQLKASIKDGSYHVSTDDLVKAFLDE